METTDVLVVGAGPTGLMVAGELQRRGVATVVIDRLAAPARTCRATAVQMRTLEVFDQIGMIGEVLDRGLAVKAANLYTHGMLAHRLRMPEQPRPGMPYPFVLSLPQDQIERLLRRRYEGTGPVIRYGTELVDLAEEQECAVATVCRAGCLSSVRARYVVGADGAHSRVRVLRGMTSRRRTESWSYLLADATLHGEHAPDESYRFMAGDESLVAWPIGGRGRFFLTGPDPTAPPGADTQPPADGIRRICARLIPWPVTLADVRWAARYQVHSTLAARYSAGRTMLAGDAAHTHPTTGGLGLNTGLQDAFNLGWKLAAVIRDEAGNGLLQTYESERRPVALEVLRTATTLFREALPSDEDEARARIVRAVTQTDIAYPVGPAVAASTVVESVRTGVRAPDLAVPTGGSASPRRLYELLRAGRFVCVVTGVAPGRLRTELTAFPGGGDLLEAPAARRVTIQALDPATAFGADRVVVIRPDGYIGYQGHISDAAGASRYLKGLSACATSKEFSGRW